MDAGLTDVHIQYNRCYCEYSWLTQRLITFSSSFLLDLGKNPCCRAIRLVATTTDCYVMSASCSHPSAFTLRCTTKKSDDFWRISCFRFHRGFGSVKWASGKPSDASSSIKGSSALERDGWKYHDDLLHVGINSWFNGWLCVREHARTTQRIPLSPISLRSEEARRVRNNYYSSYDDNSACANINLSYHVHVSPNDIWANFHGSHDTRKFSKLNDIWSQQHVTQWKLNHKKKSSKYSKTFNVSLILNVQIKYFLIIKCAYESKLNCDIVV